MKRFVISAICLLSLIILQQYCLGAEVRKVLLRDKTELLYIKDTTAKSFKMSFYMRFGPFLETKQTQGISRILGYQMKAYMEKKINFPSTAKLVFNQGYTGFEVGEVDTNFVIGFMRMVYREAIGDSVLFRQSYQKAYDDWMRMSKPNEFQRKFEGSIWEENVFKIFPTTPQNLKDSLTFQELKNFYQAYILPPNSLLIITGPIESQEFIDQVSAYMLGGDNSKNVYVSLGRTNIYRNLINSSQYIIPDTFKNINGNLNVGYQVVCDMRENNGYLYYQLYNEYLQKFLESKQIRYTGMNFLGSSFYIQRFAGFNNLSFQIEKPEFAPIQMLRDSLSNIRFDSLITEYDFQNNIKSKVDSFERVFTNPINLTKSLLYWWDIHSLDYGLNYIKHVKSLTTRELQQFYERHIQYSQNVVVLRTGSKMTGTEYVMETNDTVVKRIITFENNLNDVTEQKYKNILISILQFLLINPDVTISVHGVADKSEYIKAEAPELESFIAKYPKFRIMGRKTNKITWQRMDMVRALKVVKFFTSNGISPDRITGTGIIKKAESKEKMSENRIIYFSYDKLRLHSSQSMGRR